MHYVKKGNIYYLEKSKIKKSHLLYNISGSVIPIISNYNFKILIEKDYNENKLKKKFICIFLLDLIKKVDYDTWLKILHI